MKTKAVNKDKMKARHMRAFVRMRIDPNKAVLITDEYKGYTGMEKVLPHMVIKHQEWFVDGNIHTNSIESFWALLKRGMFGQFHSVSRRHLQRYVDEFCYRYNRRQCQHFRGVQPNHHQRIGGDPMSVPKATHTGELNIGASTIECAVLEDGTRILTQSSFLRAISQSHKPAGQRIGFERIAPFLASNNLKPFINKELSSSNTKMIFKLPRGGQAVGYKAELLPHVCEVYLKARDAGVLIASQMRTAAACETLMRGLAYVGIIALVDEATKYQEIRDRKILQEILDKYLLADHAKWAKRFPDEFYREIFRLRGWQWQGMRVNRPQVVGHYTNDIVWDRLAPRVREELEQLNPKTEKGTRRVKHHQWLTYDIGHPALQKHLTGVIALMKSVRSSPHKAWTEFQRRLQRVFPKVNTNLELQFPDEDFDDA